MRRFLVSSLLLHICALVDPSRKSTLRTGWFVVVRPPVRAQLGLHLKCFCSSLMHPEIHCADHALLYREL